MSEQNAQQGENGRPPRDNLYRVAPEALEVRSEGEGPNGRPVLFGYFARFNEWTEIDSMFEGHFMERFAPGAFKKTLRENTPKVLFQHGADPTIGKQPIAEIIEVREDDEGAYYEAELFDGIPDLVVSGLRAGVYGASFQFSVMREDKVQHPERSEHNPDGIQERTVREARVPEFSPVTFPAYENATAGLRATAGFRTDLEFLQRLTAEPDRLREYIQSLPTDDPSDGSRSIEQVSDPVDADPQPQVEGEGHLEREQEDNAPPQETPAVEATSLEGRRDKAGSPLRLPSTHRPRRPGVLPDREGDDEPWKSHIRLP